MSVMNRILVVEKHWVGENRFLWIFLGAPSIEHLRGNKWLSTVLSAITAAVVGVILNLAIWFSLNVIFSSASELYVGNLRLYVPDISSTDYASLLIAIAAFIALFKYKASMLVTLAVAGFPGLPAVPKLITFIQRKESVYYVMGNPLTCSR